MNSFMSFPVSFHSFVALGWSGLGVSLTFSAGANFAPQFQQNVSETRTRAPHRLQLPWAAECLGAGAGGWGGGGGAVGGGAALGGGPTGATGGFRVGRRGGALTGGVFGFGGAPAPGVKTAPHSVQEGCVSVTCAAQTGQTKPRKTIPRLPNPRSRFGSMSSSRLGSNRSSRFKSKFSRLPIRSSSGRLTSPPVDTGCLGRPM